MKNPTIAIQAKNEVLDTPILDVCCQKAFLIALFKGTGYIAINNLGWWLGFTFYEQELLYFSANIISKLLKSPPTITEKKKEGALKFSYSIDLNSETSKELLKLWKINFDGEGLDNFPLTSLLHQECCKKAALKALFLANGSLSLPSQTNNSKNNTGYHLELRVFYEKLAQEILLLLASFGITGKIRKIKTTYAVYIKDSESISDFLAAIDAVKSLFKLQDTIMYRSISNDSNRGRNCNIANIQRAIDAATKQLNNIKYIELHYGLENLPPELKSLAKARLEFPEFTLDELAKHLGDTTKSGINHRMRKLTNLAKELQPKQP